MLASDCQVSRRTIFRDLDVLRTAGVPLAFHQESQSYRIPEAYLLPPTHLTTEEALAVLVLCDELGADHKLPFYGPARSAALKLQATLPARLRDYLQEITSAIRIDLPQLASLGDKAAIYQQLIDALAKRQSVRIAYDSFSEGSEIRSRLSPYRLMFSRRSWYVIGRSSLHRGVRTFHLGRIQELQSTADGYRIPRNFSLERYLKNAWQLIPEPGPDRQVRVRFEPLVARNVAEINWHRTQELTWNADGSLDFRATVSGLNEISWWILGYGDQAEALEPPELRTLIATRARRMAERIRRSGFLSPNGADASPNAAMAQAPTGDLC